MAARLIRTWCDDLCLLKLGAIIPLVLCGIALGAVIAMCMHKPSAAGKPAVQPSSGQVQAACQTGNTAASAAPPAQEFQYTAQGGPAPIPYPGQIYTATKPNAYNIYEPDWGGTSYRLKTIVNQ
jgi:hypothetical protein